MRVGVREWKNSYLELALEPHKLNYSLSQTRTCNSNLKRAKPFAAVAQCTVKKEPRNPNKDLGNVRNLAYLALSENDQISDNQAGYVRCATCVITRGVSSICVWLKALGRASDKTWILRHATFFFAPTGLCQEKRREKYEKTVENESRKKVLNFSNHSRGGILLASVYGSS